MCVCVCVHVCARANYVNIWPTYCRSKYKLVIISCMFVETRI